MTATTDADLNVTCTAEGHPRPLIAWRHNGRAVGSDDDSKFRVTVEENSSKLTIFNATLQETGILTCYAMNYLSFVQVDMELWLTSDDGAGDEIEVAPYHFSVLKLSRKNVHVLSSIFEFENVSNGERMESS